MSKEQATNEEKVILAKIEFWTKVFSDLTYLCRHVVTIGGLIWIFSIVMTAIGSMVTANPAAIHEIANVIQAIKLNQITSMMLGTLATAWAVAERRGRKRAIEKAGRLQAKLEKNDPYNSRSGLTPTGDTPGDIDD